MRKTLLIVCEGQTEKCYFESFPVRTVKVEVVNLEGQSKLKLVECAEEMVRGDGYDEVWCVFDMDVKFYLHYNYTDTAQRRSFYYDQLSKFWSINYVDEGKRYSFCTGNYDKLRKDHRASQQNAIENAKKLFIDQQDKPFHEQNPVTTVYQLVSILNQCSRCSQMSFEGEV